MSGELVLEHSIVEMHADLDPWAVLSVGFDDDKNLVFALTIDGDDNRGRKSIVVDQDSVSILADRLGVKLTKLPETLSEQLGSEEESWSMSEVVSAFDSVAFYLSSLNIKHRIIK